MDPCGNYHLASILSGTNSNFSAYSSQLKQQLSISKTTQQPCWLIDYGLQYIAIKFLIAFLL